MFYLIKIKKGLKKEESKKMLEEKSFLKKNARLVYITSNQKQAARSSLGRKEDLEEALCMLIETLKPLAELVVRVS